MSQCHDIYSWDSYHGGHWVAPEGTQCHDSDERQLPKTSASAPRNAEAAVEAADPELQAA